MKKILLAVYALATFIIIALHSQTIPFILMMVFILLASVFYYRQKKRQQNEFNELTLQKDAATLQLQHMNKQPDSQVLFSALAGIQSQIIQNEISKFATKPAPRVALPLFNETRYVAVNDIVRCEADNTYTKFMLIGGEEILVSKTLKEYTDVLSEHLFVRTHQSHLVNTFHVKSWLREDGGSLLLNDGTKIPVSKLNRDKVKEILKT
ncbi:LytR/AlgR family response regulator transcription factor [Mucilaginibacter pedocola]|uniref:HTH LytTR-type domain-containing protein n=1 Tax=Mucilaginibacter pedocola TaxID=1792845 RepID=A0A1S9PJ93_9SPHI|nr:LytTR family DNA-binding domain-containing protein [Mucilaginibacter pedocola]OOQ60648.1 hypothetical protein BC343_23925 [Mucilaginibacter pedocola]